MKELLLYIAQNLVDNPDEVTVTEREEKPEAAKQEEMPVMRSVTVSERVVEKSDELMMLIKRLPDGYRTILNLYAIEGRSHREIADLLGISPETSASQLHRAKLRLAKMIRELMDSKY